MTYDVFISHSKVDEKYAIAAHDTLESSGLKCWIAPKDIDPGEEWGDEIIKAIKSSRVMLVVLSSSANKSKHIRREVTQAEGEGLPVIVFRIEDVMPEGSLAYYFNTIHWLDAFPEPREKHPQLIEAVRRSLIGDPAPIPTPPPPPTFPRWLIVVIAALLAAAAVVGALKWLRRDPTTVIVNANATPAISPSSTPTASPTSTTPSPSPIVNSTVALPPTATPTAPPPPPDDTDAKVTQLINALNAPDSTEGARSDVIFSLGPLAKRDLGTHERVVRQLTEFIRRRARAPGQCSRTGYKTLPPDLQAALDVLATREWYYGKGEKQRLELQDTDLSGAVFKEGGHFEGVRLRGACLNYAFLEKALFTGADLYGASVKNFSVTETDFEGADLRMLKGFETDKDLRDWLCVSRNVDARLCPKGK